MLAQHDAAELVLRRGGHADCLDVWPKPTFDSEVDRRIGTLDSFSVEYERLTRQLLADIEIVRPDAEGRVVLPKRMIEAAGLAGDVVLTGRHRFFQVWDAARHGAAMAAEPAAA